MSCESPIRTTCLKKRSRLVWISDSICGGEHRLGEVLQHWLHGLCRGSVEYVGGNVVKGSNPIFQSSQVRAGFRGRAGAPGPRPPTNRRPPTKLLNFIILSLAYQETMFLTVIFIIFFWGLCRRPPPGLCPWTPLGDFRPPDPVVPPPSFISKHATAHN